MASPEIIVGWARRICVAVAVGAAVGVDVDIGIGVNVAAGVTVASVVDVAARVAVATGVGVAAGVHAANKTSGMIIKTNRESCLDILILLLEFSRVTIDWRHYTVISNQVG
jgi:hypothetical protein